MKRVVAEQGVCCSWKVERKKLRVGIGSEATLWNEWFSL